MEDERFSIPVNIRGTFFNADFATRIFERVFVGPRFSTFLATTKIFPDSGGPPGLSDPRLEEQFSLLELDGQTTSLGFEVMRDTRDSRFYPRSGSLTSFRAGFFGDALGSDFTYEKYTANFNIYRSLGKYQVLAATPAACGVNGDVPFFDLCYLGQEKHLRGYRVGWHQDVRMFAAQAEYRLELFWRVGLVGFFGVGQVASGFGEFSKENWLPGGGFGFRFLVAEENHVSLRIDFAWGRDSSATYISGGEAF